MGGGTLQDMSRNLTTSPVSPPRCKSVSPTPNLDFVLTGRKFENFLPANYLNVEVTRSRRKKTPEISFLSKKVNRINVVNVLRRNLKLKYDMRNTCWGLHDSSGSEDDNGIFNHSSDSLEELTGIKGFKAEMFQ